MGCIPTFATAYMHVSSGPTAGATGPKRTLHFDPLGDLQRIIELNAEVSDRAVHLSVAKQELHSPKVTGFFVYLRDPWPDASNAFHTRSVQGRWM